MEAQSVERRVQETHSKMFLVTCMHNRMQNTIDTVNNKLSADRNTILISNETRDLCTVREIPT